MIANVMILNLPVNGNIQVIASLEMVINNKMIENIYANAMMTHIPVHGMKEMISTLMNAHLEKTIASV